ncbi:MAG: histidine phosphatase family protein [Myxococcota bacterium]
MLGLVSGTRFLIIRHAESEWNVSERWQGHGDPSLSARGRKQAQSLADELAGENVEALYSSDLARAIETATIIGAHWGLQPQLNRNLRELEIGEWTGLTRSEIEKRDAQLLARFDAEDPDVRPGGGESRREIRSRVRREMARIAAEHPSQRVAIVTHLGAVRALFPGTEPANSDWRWADGSQLAR